jgi:hypothetical protein
MIENYRIQGPVNTHKVNRTGIESITSAERDIISGEELAKSTEEADKYEPLVYNEVADDKALRLNKVEREQMPQAQVINSQLETYNPELESSSSKPDQSKGNTTEAVNVCSDVDGKTLETEVELTTDNQIIEKNDELINKGATEAVAERQELHIEVANVDTVWSLGDRCLDQQINVRRHHNLKKLTQGIGVFCKELIAVHTSNSTCRSCSMQEKYA